jgi:predicted N-acyltransferase
MQTEIHHTLLNISPDEWDELNHDGNPFTSYAFLSALEESACIGGETGWLPRYLLIRNNQGKLAGALPMYEKHHSWGEYVFDWAWANAWQQCGLEYYPKLIVAVPFSPVSGHRFLVAGGQHKEETIRQLQTAAIDFAKNESYSSLHYLFPTPHECERLQQQGLLIRHDVQFHWRNNDYPDFQEFLATMNSRKRKKICRERRRVGEMGVEFKIVIGDALTAIDIEQMYAFYLSTIMTHGSHPYLNKNFFLLLAEHMADDIVLIQAHYQGVVIAAALNIQHGDILYGRYWGCKEDFQLTTAISDFLEKEKAHVAHYQQILNEHSPFKGSNEKV